MAVTVTNLLQGPAQLLVAATDAVEPQYADAAPGVEFRDLGGTDGGARLVTGQTYSNMTVDQIALPVGSRLVSQEVTIATSLAEATLANMALALNQADPGATGEIELDSTISNSEPLYKKFLIVGQKPGGGPRIVVVRRALSTQNVEMAWTKDNKTMIPVTFFGYYVDEATSALRISDAVTPTP